MIEWLETRGIGRCRFERLSALSLRGEDGVGRWDSAAASRELELELELPGSLARGWRRDCGNGERKVAGGGGEAGGGDASGPEASNSQPACEAAAPATRASLRPGAGRIDIPRRRVARSTAMHSARDLAGSRARWRAGALLAPSSCMWHRRCQSAPHHPFPRRYLPPARLIQKR